MPCRQHSARILNGRLWACGRQRSYAYVAARFFPYSFFLSHLSIRIGRGDHRGAQHTNGCQCQCAVKIYRTHYYWVVRVCAGRWAVIAACVLISIVFITKHIAKQCSISFRVSFVLINLFFRSADRQQLHPYVWRCRYFRRLAFCGIEIGAASGLLAFSAVVVSLYYNWKKNENRSTMRMQ